MANQLTVTPANGYPAVFAPQHLAWVLQGLQCADPARPEGEGSERLPYRMSSIEQWAGAAAIELKSFDKSGMNAQEAIAESRRIGNDRGLYMIGGRLLERTPAGAYANYITDVVDGGKGIGALKLGGSSLARPRGFEAPTRDGTPVYDTKFKRLAGGAAESGKPLFLKGNNADMARQARALLKGEQKMSIAASDELPGTLGALFLAEVSREKRMLPLTLMLLDLIEAKVPGFTWSSLMTDRGEQLTGGVRHPMVHFGAQAQAGANMFKSFNDVTKRAVAILAAWLAANPSKVGGWTVAAADVATKDGLPKQIAQVDKAIGTKPDSDTSKTAVLWRFHTDYILPAVQRRAATLDCLLA